MTDAAFIASLSFFSQCFGRQPVGLNRRSTNMSFYRETPLAECKQVVCSDASILCTTLSADGAFVNRFHSSFSSSSFALRRLALVTVPPVRSAIPAMEESGNDTKGAPDDKVKTD